MLVRYGDDVEGWTVYANQTRGDCLIVRQDGPSVGANGRYRKSGGRVSWRVHEGGYRPSEREHSRKSSSPSTAKLYSGVATSTSGELKGGYSGGYILTDDPNFKRAVAKKYEMTVFPETKGTFVVDLKGTFKAMAVGRKCLAQ